MSRLCSSTSGGRLPTYTVVTSSASSPMPCPGDRGRPEAGCMSGFTRPGIPGCRFLLALARGAEGPVNPVEGLAGGAAGDGAGGPAAHACQQGVVGVRELAGQQALEVPGRPQPAQQLWAMCWDSSAPLAARHCSHQHHGCSGLSNMRLARLDSTTVGGMRSGADCAAGSLLGMPPQACFVLMNPKP